MPHGLALVRSLAAAAAAVAASLGPAACSDDPHYIYAPINIEVGTGAPGDQGIGTASIDLPYDAAYLGGMAYAIERREYLAALNARFDPDVAEDQLPLVRLDQLALSIEWTIKNLSDQDGTARIHVNGANPYWAYVPTNFVVDPTDDDEPVPPPLAGDVPIRVPAGRTIHGVFREDQLHEAAIDLELITRGQINPFRAVLATHEDIRSTADVPFTSPDPMNPVEPPPPLPIEAFGHFVRFDLTFVANRHMVLEVAVRVRDRHRPNLIHPALLDAPPEELYPFAPAAFVPVLPP